MKSSETSIVVIASRAGRLGNRLFQGAHFMGNALTRGYRLLNPSLGEYAPLFEGSRHDPLCAFPCAWNEVDCELAEQFREVLYAGIHLTGLAASFGVIPGVTTIDIRKQDENDELGIDLSGSEFGKLLNSEKLILPMGWKFYDHESLRLHREEISRYFTPIEPVVIESGRVMDRARRMGDFVIGVHIRQEDYRFWKGGIHYYETFSYVKWMRQCLEIFANRSPAFMVCSSNPLEEKLLEGLNVIKGPGSVAGDIHALSQCDAIMGPPSTFSMWASYYGKTPLCMLQSVEQQVKPEDFLQRF